MEITNAIKGETVQREILNEFPGAAGSAETYCATTWCSFETDWSKLSGSVSVTAHPVGERWTFLCLAPSPFLSPSDLTSHSFIIYSHSPVSWLLKTRQFSLENQSWHIEKLMTQLLLNAKLRNHFFNIKPSSLHEDLTDQSGSALICWMPQ